VLRLIREVDGFRRMELHIRRQLVRLGARLNIRIDGESLAEFPVHLEEHPHLAVALRRIGSNEAMAALEEAVAKGSRGARNAARGQIALAPRREQNKT